MMLAGALGKPGDVETNPRKFSDSPESNDFQF